MGDGRCGARRRYAGWDTLGCQSYALTAASGKKRTPESEHLSGARMLLKMVPGSQYRECNSEGVWDKGESKGIQGMNF